MKVAYLTALRELQIREEPRPVLGRADDVLLRIERVGVCGSDVHYFTEGGIGDDRVPFPASVGHECAGSVVEVGAEVEKLKPGDRVAVDPAIVCGHCDQCRAGRINTCRNLQFMGCPGEADGAMAEYRILPAANCLPVPDDMSLEMAVLAEPLSIGLHAARLGEVYPAARVAILGSGPIGLSVLICAKTAAPCTVYMTDLIDSRLEAAKAYDADWTGNPTQEDVVEAIGRREQWGLDIVFECSGDPACIDQAIRLLTPGGTLVLVGIPPAPRIDIDMHGMRRKELVLQNVRRQRGCMVPAIRLMGESEVDFQRMLTHRFALEESQQAFELVADYADGVIKAIVDLS